MAPVLDGFTGEQRVFIGYAQGWMGKSRDEALRQQINTDPHSPDNIGLTAWLETCRSSMRRLMLWKLMFCIWYRRTG